MVKPYLSRFRPAGSGPGLRPRPRSRFEPAPASPVDGPGITGPGLSLPPALDEAGDVAAELGPDPPHPHLAGPAAAHSEWELPPAQAAVPEPAPPGGEPTPAPAAATASPPRPSHAPATRPAPGGQRPRPARNAPPEPAPPGGEPTPAPAAATASPPRPSHAPATRPAPGGQRPRPARNAPPEPAPPGGEPTPAPAAATASPPRPSHAPATGGSGQQAAGNVADFPAARTGTGGQASPGSRPGAVAPAPEPAPPEPPPAAHRHVGRPGQPADGLADRVQAMARWLRDADAAAHAQATARPPAGPQPAGPGRVLAWPGPAVHPDVTVTIGRIEVKAPAPDPPPAPPRLGETRRRVPSLDDYLESRTRVRGRPG